MARALYAVISLRGISGAAIAIAVILPVMIRVVHSVPAGFGHMALLGARGPDLDAWRGLAVGLGWDRPAELATVGDPWDLALILDLVQKQVPFLIVILLGA